jgi:hypothetical protein
MKSWKPTLSLGLILTCILATPPASAQQPPTDELKKDIEGLKDGMKAIQKDPPQEPARWSSTATSKCRSGSRQESFQGRAQRQADAGRVLGLPVTVLRQVRP